MFYCMYFTCDRSFTWTTPAERCDVDDVLLIMDSSESIVVRLDHVPHQSYTGQSYWSSAQRPQPDGNTALPTR